MAERKPSQQPPARITGNGAESAGTATRPRELTTAESFVSASRGASSPTLAPPSEAARAEGIGAWQQNQRINALWSINEVRNSWVGVQGTGWKKLANNSDSALMALTILGAHARQLQSAVNYRDEADGMIREMYVF